MSNHTQEIDCIADIGTVCHCPRCAASKAYWRSQGEWMMREAEYSEQDVLDAYSEPSQRAKRDVMLERNR